MTPQRHLAEIFYWYPYRWSVSYMPAGGELRTNRALGYLHSASRPEEVRRVAENVHRGLPTHPNPERIARQSLMGRFLARGAAVSLPRITPETLGAYVDVRGIEALREAIASGRGAILTYPHTGPYNLALKALSLMGIPINRLGLPDPWARDGEEGDDDGDSLLAMPARAARRDLLVDLPGALFDGRGYLRPVLRALKQGQALMVSYDGSPPGVDQIGRRVEVELMGQRAHFPVGPVYLALRAGVPLFPIAMRTPPEGGPYTLDIDPPLELIRGADLRETLQMGAARLALHLDDCLRDEPGGWQLWTDFEPGRLLS